MGHLSVQSACGHADLAVRVTCAGGIIWDCFGKHTVIKVLGEDSIMHGE